jgi:hypothetical protein
MFSYQNKVVAIKATRTSGSGAIDVLVNNAYIGSITGTGQGDSAYFIASNNSSLSLASAYSSPTGYPSSVYFVASEFNIVKNSGVANNEWGPLSGYYDLTGASPMGVTFELVNTGSGSPWRIKAGLSEYDQGGSDPSNPYGDYEFFYGIADIDINISENTPAEVPVYYFSDLLLNVGSNDLCTSNQIGNAAISSLEIDLYDLSGSTLVNPSPIPATNFLTVTGSFTWSGASANAVSSGGRLAVLNTFRKSNIPTRSLDLYIGATDTGVEGEWRWLDGSLLSGGYENWAEGEPNDYPPLGEDYAYSFVNNTWNDGPNSGNAYPFLVGGYLLEKPDNFCYIFDLQYPAGRTVPLTETPPVFNIDTGNLNQVFTGSGVHLKKDVTLFFDILDQQLNTVSSNQQFLENPLISGCVFDILNVDGTIASENFFTGKYSRSLAFSALDNENVFGSYQKDFGVRCKLPNTFDGSIFTGEFYAYGNVPNILDIVPDYTEFSGAAQATELINTAIVLQNDLNFTQMDRYDVYALTGSGSAVNELTYLSPFAEEGYLFSQSASNVVNARSLTINRGALPQDVPHYFTVVPYGTLGSGSSFTFGPATFVTVENIIVFDQTNSSALNLYDGNSFGQTVYKTGRFLSNTGLLHEFSSGQFTSVKYFIEVSGSGQRRLSELKGVVNTTGFDLTKESVNDTSTQYQLTGSSSGQCGLFASGSGYANYSYKLQATMI